MFGMLVHVRRDQTKFSAGRQHTKALLKNGTSAFQKARVNRFIAKIFFSFSVVSLVPIRRACDNQTHGIRRQQFHGSTVAKNNLRMFFAFCQRVASLTDNFGIIWILFDANTVASKFNRGNRRSSSSSERIKHRLSVK